MRDKPYGAALLDAARQALMDEVAPALSGRSRYVALMVANAMGIASREIEASERSTRAWDAAVAREDGTDLDVSIGRLVAAIREGRHDGDAALHAALTETADVAAEIWKPGKPAAKA